MIMPENQAVRNPRITLLRRIFTSPRFILLFAVMAIAYYFLVRFIITASSQGLFLTTMPVYYIYALAMTSSLLITISIYQIAASFKQKFTAAGEGAASAITTIAGGLVTSCGCSSPILTTILYDIGINVIGVSGTISFIASNQEWLISIAILANLALSYYSLGTRSKNRTSRRSRSPK